MSFVTQNENCQRLRRVHIAEMGRIDLASDVSSYFKALTVDIMEKMAEQLIALLNRHASPAPKAVPSVAS